MAERKKSFTMPQAPVPQAPVPGSSKVPPDLIRGCEMLFFASAGDIPMMERYWKEDNKLIHFADYDARSTLHLTASEGHVEATKWLLKMGVDVNAMDRWGNSPLQDALRGKFVDVRDILLTAGAIPPAANSNKMQLVGEVLQYASDGSLAELKELFAVDKSIVNFHDYDNRYPLHLSASEGHYAVVEWLVLNGAEVNIKDRWNGTPLEDAIRTGRAQIIDFMASKGGRIYEEGKLVKMHTLPARDCQACIEEQEAQIASMNAG